MDANGTDVANVLLVGGPAWFNPPSRVVRAERLQPEVKVANGLRIEHFFPTTNTVAIDGGECLVYQWVYCTRIAE